jgi:hypothetical protein
MRTATADVSDSICGMTAAVSERAAGCCHAERTPTIPTTWTRPWPAIAAVPDPVSGCAARELPCPRGYRRDHYVSTLVAGGRTLAGHPSGASDRRGHQHVTAASVATCAGHSPSGRWSFRKQRTVNPPIAPSLQLSLLSSRPALRAAAAAVLAPATTRWEPGNRPHPHTRSEHRTDSRTRRPYKSSLMGDAHACR